MTLHYRTLPDLTGVHLGPLPASEDVIALGARSAPFGASVRATPARPPLALPAVDGLYARRVKRVIDVVLASAALVLILPVLVLLAAALWLESGNPFYAQERLGRNGRRFRMWKLRTMVPDADRQLAQWLARDPALRAEWELTQKLKKDPRITPIGRLLRRTSMDELPQILNVIKGDMSLVGPRPMLPEQMPLYRHPQAYLSLRPGLTGLWQVTARNEDSFDLRATLDLRYAQRLGPALDLRIIVATFGVVLNATGY